MYRPAVPAVYLSTVRCPLYISPRNVPLRRAATVIKSCIKYNDPVIAAAKVSLKLVCTKRVGGDR